MTLTLQLQCSVNHHRPTTAWFLPGTEVDRWVEELVRCDLARPVVRVYPMARGEHDATLAGALVVWPSGLQPSGTLAGFGCGFVGERLCLPVEAQLLPELETVEVDRLCGSRMIFLHPTLGAVSFQRPEGLTVAELLEAPEERLEQWNSARAGVRGLAVLSEILLCAPPRLEELFREVKGEIGSAPASALPAAPGEPGEDPRSHWERTVRGWLARGVSSAAQSLPAGSGPGAPWVQRMQGWAARQLEQRTAEMDKLRHKELHRLLHLLSTDPEAGLRHAIPMNQFAHRGRALPSAELGERTIDFNAGHLGGKPADFWEVPPQLQEHLRRHYRSLADREMHLGRFRRAAYVYAHLLGELASAANALKQGRHFREAALLYQQQLHNPLEAAHCLSEGGLLQEAMEGYEKLGRLKEMAELQERMEHFDQARETWIRLIEQRRETQDFLGAAKLLEERLHAPDEALMELARGWPASRQALQCLRERFALLQRLARPEAAVQLLSEFRTHIASLPNAPLLTDVLVELARRSPDARVRHLAGDLCCCVVARQLLSRQLPMSSVIHLSEQVLQLAPQDRLLSRDVNRFLGQRRQELHEASLRQTSTSRPIQAAGSVKTVRVFQLPERLQWIEVRSESRWFFALGGTASRTVVVRGVWEGNCQLLSLPLSLERMQHGIIFESTRDGGRSLALHSRSEATFAPRCFPAEDLFFSQECDVSGLSWLSTEAFPVAFDDQAVWSLAVSDGSSVLSHHTHSGQLLQTRELTPDLLGNSALAPSAQILMVALPQGVAIALGHRLLVLRPDGGITCLELPGQVTRLFVTPKHSRSAVVACLEQGAILHWCGTQDWVELDRDMATPFGTFLGGGMLVLVGKGAGQVMDVDSRGIHGVTSFTPPDPELIGVEPAPEPDEFALFTKSGKVHILRHNAQI